MSDESLSVTLSTLEKRFLMEAGYILRDQGRFGEAMTVFSGLLPFIEQKHVALVEMGSVAFEQGEYAHAVAYYREAVVLEPSSAFALAHLGEALLHAGHHEEAERVLTCAIKLDRSGDAGGAFARHTIEFLNERKTKGDLS